MYFFIFASCEPLNTFTKRTFANKELSKASGFVGELFLGEKSIEIQPKMQSFYSIKEFFNIRNLILNFFFPAVSVDKLLSFILVTYAPLQSVWFQVGCDILHCNHAGIVWCVCMLEYHICFLCIRDVSIFFFFFFCQLVSHSSNKEKLPAQMYTYKPSNWITITALIILASQPDLYELA